MKEVLHAKITGYVTEAVMDYGSITIGKDLLKFTGMKEGQMVYVNGNNFNKRIRTYIREGEDGQICLNGNASVLFNKGDMVHILATEFLNDYSIGKTSPIKIECKLKGNKNVITL